MFHIAWRQPDRWKMFQETHSQLPRAKSLWLQLLNENIKKITFLDKKYVFLQYEYHLMSLLFLHVVIPLIQLKEKIFHKLCLWILWTNEAKRMPIKWEHHKVPWQEWYIPKHKCSWISIVWEAKTAMANRLLNRMFFKNRHLIESLPKKERIETIAFFPKTGRPITISYATQPIAKAGIT